MLTENSPITRLESKLQLKKFTWIKVKQIDTIEFELGLNILSERNQAERTIILRLIRYAMGGSSSRIDDEIMKITKEVSLEFLVNDKLITTRRSFDHPTGKFPLVQESQREIQISPHDMGEFLLDALKIPKVRYQAGDREGRTLLSFNNISRALVVDRDFSYTEIMSKEYPEPRKETTKLMLGLTTQEIADAEEEVRDADLRVQSLNEEIRGVERLLTDFNVGTLLDIQQRRNNLLKLLDEAQAEDDALREKIQKDASQGTSFSEGKEEYQVMHDELLTKRNRISDIDSELALLTRQIVEKTDLKSILESEVQKLERHTASHYILSTFTFSKCPRCLREIEANMKEREREGECMLCGRSLQHDSEPNEEIWAKALADAQKAVQEADQLIGYYDTRTQSLGHERHELQERIEWLQSELNRQTARYVSPLVENLSLINERRAQILKALAGIDLEEKQRRYADDLRDVTLPELKKARQEWREKMEELQVRRGRRSERIGGFIDHFTYFMRRAASAQFKSSSWDEASFLPQVNNQDYTKALSGFDLAIAVLSFHYALLALKVKPPSFDTAHPGLLIVDEPQQQMMGAEQYQMIMQLFADLANAYKDDIQIIVATTDASKFEDYLQPILVNLNKEK